MSWYEYEGPDREGLTDPDTEIAFIRENMPPATSCRYDDARLHRRDLGH